MREGERERERCHWLTDGAGAGICKGEPVAVTLIVFCIYRIFPLALALAFFLFFYFFLFVTAINNNEITLEHTALHSEKVHSAKCAMVQNPMGIYHVHEKEDKKTQGRQRTWSEVVLWCMLQQCKGQFTVIVRWSVVTVHMGRGGGMECKQGKTKTETGASEDMVFAF